MESKDGGDPLGAVKRSVRPDWITSENKIFINKLNFICENFDKNHEDVSCLERFYFYLQVKKMKVTVNRNHRTELDDLAARIREFTDDF